MTEKKVYAAISGVASALAEQGIRKEKNKGAKLTTPSVASTISIMRWPLSWLRTGS